MEIERKFLVKKIPSNLNEYDNERIEQGYLSINPEVRVRSKKGKCYLTVKGEGTLSREEYETLIKSETYNDLSSKIQGKLLVKDRYNIPLDNDCIAELDIYINLDWLTSIVEVEFENIESANNFIVPEWFGVEVTDDRTYKNKNLALQMGG